MVGFTSDEGGQERMVNVDDFVFVGAAELVGDNLHVPRQNHQINPQLLQQGQFLSFLFGFGLLSDLEYMEGNLKGIGYVLQVRMIRDDGDDLTVQLSRPVSQQEFPQAVIVLAHQNGDSLLAQPPFQLVFHLEARANVLNPGFQGDPVGVKGREVEMNALKE